MGNLHNSSQRISFYFRRLLFQGKLRISQNRGEGDER